MKPSTDHALIAHFDIDALRDTGQAVWQLIYIDLRTAQEGVRATLAAEAYHRKVKFIMPATTTTLGEPSCTPTDTTKPTSKPLTSGATSLAATPPAADDTSGSTTNPDPTPTPLTPSSPEQLHSLLEDDRRADLLARYAALNYTDQAKFQEGVRATLAAEEYHRKVKFIMPATTTTLGEPSCAMTLEDAATADGVQSSSPAMTTTAPSRTSGFTTNPDPTPAPTTKATTVGSPRATQPDSRKGKNDEQRRDDLLARYAALNYTDQAKFRALGIPRDDLDAIEAAIVELEVDPFDRVTPPPEPEPEPDVQIVELDDGDPIGNETIDGLLADIAASAHKETINRWARQASDAGLTIDVRTHRRYRYWLVLYLALQLAEAFRGDDETVVAFISLMEDDIGPCLARMSIDEALDTLARLAAIAEMADDMIPEQQTLLG